MNKIYSRLAFTNIKNNKTLYMPYIISGMVMIAITEGLLLFSDILDYRKSRIEEKLEK